jgi:HAD superfamily hydrolase (TIGR01509 family)
VKLTRVKKRRFIDRFDVILLDMAHTFMFGVDRFSETDDFAATYRRIGGRALTDIEVRQIIATAFNTMLADSRNPHSCTWFASVRRYLQMLSPSRNLSGREIILLEHVFALHEVGIVPDASAETLHRLRQAHRLGIVSDIWSRNDLYLREFARAGIRELFDVIVFSSDYGRLKPSPYLFHKAVEAFAVERGKVVFVGDSLTRDIAGAKAVGLSAVWINPGQEEVAASLPSPDLVIQDLRELLEA